ncbi:hypothetical protein DI487_04855 [Flavobacterium sediminis]|uniref:Uncharacterized protein n=1 Tax=Flavobacterium sediminis TaxID=2201181 RepID=A0A2U8QSZ1_9FLAO|nr:hypothetical protein [Flavobacterium sediminis]AWM13258.1 hypothetical protein DI487_04855 [Flavobacterium sediminis]
MSAISALKGYRTQFLYSLYRILSNHNEEYIFKVEGKYEDLDILDSSYKYIETIQIKNKGETLSFSDMFSKKDSFFKRAEELVLQDPDVIVKIVSFNKISDDLTDKEKLNKKLQKKGFKKINIDKTLTSYCSPEIVDEETLVNKIISIIKSYNIFTNPEIALELLLFWIYKSGENQKEIRTKNLFEDLNKIGKFLSEQSSFNNQFGNSIIPLSIKSLKNEDTNLLHKGFYYGVSAKFEHILANLDVVRNEKLEIINSSLKKTNIFFIHGASGQGKSTLAYRYLHNYVDSNTAYELKLSDRLGEVFETINCLDSLSKGLKFPITLYIDVSPENNYWNEVLKELSTKSNLNFLITIRQEDWNRTSLGVDFDFDDLELTFDKKEAEIIYKSLSEYKLDLKFTDFEESWLQHGERGMLLEYVYLLNQGDKLKVRLQNQVRRLEKENRIDELEILRFVCLCDSYSSKINYVALITSLNINIGISNSFVDLLENEYLLKFNENKKYLTGLHPIRSKLLCEILFSENDYIDINHYIDKSLSLIDEKDLQIFLLNSFDNGYSVETLNIQLTNIQLNSFTGLNNVFNALLWKGIYDFIFIKNKVVFDTLYNNYRGLWNFIIPYDYSEVTSGALHDLFKEYIPKEVNENIEKIQSQFTPKEDVYEYVKIWLENKKSFNSECFLDTDLSSLGRFLFWISHLKLNDKVKVNLNKDNIIKLIQANNTSLGNISELILGLEYYKSYDKLLLDIKTYAISNLRSRYNIINLDIQEHIECVYFYNPVDFEDNSNSGNNFFNDRTMEIIDLLRNVFPFKEKYNIVGIGKNFFGINMPYDPSEKSIENKNLPIPYLVQINVLINNLYLYQYRYESWSKYIEAIQAKRNKYNELSSKLINSFSDYFRTNNFKFFIDIISEIELEIKKIKTIPLPKNISDNWGYISEGKSRNTITENQESHEDKQIKSISLIKYESFRKAQRDYFSSIENFLNQIGQNILSLYKIRTEIDSIDDYHSGAITSNIKNALINHSLYITIFEKHFNKFFNKSDLDRMNKSEEDNLITMFYCWKQILNQKGNINNKVRKNAIAMFSETKENLTKKIKKERQKIFEDFGLSYTIEINNSKSKLGKTLLLTCDVNSQTYLTSLIVARIFIQNSINSDYFSFKRIIIESNIDSVIYIPLFEGKALNKRAVEISLHNLDNDIDEDNIFMYFNTFSKIENNIISHLDLSFWNEIIWEIQDYENIMGEISNMKELTNQVLSIAKEIKDSFGESIFLRYKGVIDNFLNEGIKKSQKSLNRIEEHLDIKLSNEIKNLFNRYSFDNNDVNQLEMLQQHLTENYYFFCETMIYKQIENEL